MSTDPTQSLPRPGMRPRRRDRRRDRRKGRRRHPARPWIVTVFSIVVLLLVLTIADRIAVAIAENDAASQVQSQGFPVRPAVTIKGFPFLTQVLGRNIDEADISASRVPAGPVELETVTATATGIHLGPDYTGGGVIDHVTGSALITFGSLEGAGTGGSGAASGVTIAPAGPDKVTISIGPVSERAVVKASGDTITIRAVGGGDLLSGFLSALGSLSLQVPPLPEGMRITGVAVTRQGLLISAAARHVPLTRLPALLPHR